MKNPISFNSLKELGSLATTPLRICMGWLVFSAFWRRVVLKPAALDVLSPEYEGLKFNHFIPSSDAIHAMIKYLVLHPELLYIFLWVFTIMEGLAGLGLILGLFTRACGFISFCLLFGIMLGAGWLGTTCVDEWQIGVFGISAGLVLFVTGGGPLSLDAYLRQKITVFRESRFWQFLSSGPFFIENEESKTLKLVSILSVFAILITLITNQMNIGGVWGPFHNPAVKPYISLSNASLDRYGNLKLTVYRDQGPDTYGAFIINVVILNDQNQQVLYFDRDFLAHLPEEDIQNHYLVQVKSNGQSLLVPLGGLADIELYSSSPHDLDAGTYQVEVIGIGNEKWVTSVEVP